MGYRRRARFPGSSLRIPGARCVDDSKSARMENGKMKVVGWQLPADIGVGSHTMESVDSSKKMGTTVAGEYIVAEC